MRHRDVASVRCAIVVAVFVTLIWNAVLVTIFTDAVKYIALIGQAILIAVRRCSICYVAEIWTAVAIAISQILTFVRNA